MSWWQSAVVYQVYIRSFADGNGDGVGDIAGLTERLPYLSSLGVDALWINPWYPSPMADAGYDVADYCAIEPAYGTLEQAQEFLAAAHDDGLKVILDIVPNHTSEAHRWFAEALADARGARERYHFRPGRGPGGAQPPNDWQSVFGGPAWTRLPDGCWYLHLFAPAQPDLNWEHPQVRAEFERVLRFWFDRGVDGFRIDVAHGLVKAPGLPDQGPEPGADGDPAMLDGAQHPAWDQDGVHAIYRDWRAVAGEYLPERVFIAEAWVADNDRLARYLRPDELHTAFQFDFLRAPWRASSLRAVLDDAMAAAAGVGAPPTWVLSNHDVTRTVTRYARSQPPHLVGADWERRRWADEQADHELGRRRARACALLQLALPGTAYVYQGEELGLEEVEDLPDAARQDPTFAQTGFADVGRDGCRVPLPWSGRAAPYGFSAAPVATWLPQPPHWGAHSVAAQRDDPESFLALYRAALGLRRQRWLNAGPLQWLPSRPDVLAFQRGDLQCWVNTSDDPVSLPPSSTVLLASAAGVCPPAAGESAVLPADASAWLLFPAGGA